ncbi:uncharacterized protein [Diadema antillarum]|uniref:uncharacterized protein n=1 Tax=Diadema antillarum TaxID=105358 RepID=UPI003A84A419
MPTCKPRGLRASRLKLQADGRAPYHRHRSINGTTMALRQHERKSHPDEYHSGVADAIRARPKMRWDEEELRLAASVEISAPASTHNLNQIISKVLPHRTIESIKGMRRKNARYSALLREMRCKGVSDVAANPAEPGLEQATEETSGPPSSVETSVEAAAAVSADTDDSRCPTRASSEGTTPPVTPKEAFVRISRELGLRVPSPEGAGGVAPKRHLTTPPCSPSGRPAGRDQEKKIPMEVPTDPAELEEGLGPHMQRYSGREGRTVLITKSSHPEGPSEYMPLTITSVVTRTLHRILAWRVRSAAPVGDYQKGFTDEDGTAANLALFHGVIKETKKLLRCAHCAFIDFRKAFDSVGHEAMLAAATRMGLPKTLVEYIQGVYGDATTTVFNTVVHCKRGVLQGDPLSPYLFNITLDWALAELDENIGVQLGPSRISKLALASDIVIFASTATRLATQLRRLEAGAAKVGLEIGLSKCATMSIVSDPKRKKWVTDKDMTFDTSGGKIKAMGPGDFYKEYIQGVYGDATTTVFDTVKAFDSVGHEAMLAATTRMGLPKPLVEYIQGVYGDATTTVMSNTGLENGADVDQDKSICPICCRKFKSFAEKTSGPPSSVETSVEAAAAVSADTDDSSGPTRASSEGTAPPVTPKEAFVKNLRNWAFGSPPQRELRTS